MKLNGSQILLETLLEQGTDTIFGYPGGAALNIYDELYKYSDRIRHVLAHLVDVRAHLRRLGDDRRIDIFNCISILIQKVSDMSQQL